MKTTINNNVYGNDDLRLNRHNEFKLIMNFILTLNTSNKHHLLRQNYNAYRNMVHSYDHIYHKKMRKVYKRMVKKLYDIKLNNKNGKDK